MRRVRVLGVAMSAAWAFAALAAAQASAAPQWFECAKAPKVSGEYTGHYSDENCTVPVEKGGKFELQPGVRKAKPIKMKGGGVQWVIIIPGGPGSGETDIGCTSVKGEATPALPNRVDKALLEFKGCSWGGAPCSTGLTSGAIGTHDLSGELVDLEGGGVGLELGPESGTSMAEFTCTESFSASMIGSVIAAQSGDVGEISKHSTASFVVGPGLGELEWAPGRWYTPLVNEPTHAAGGAAGEHYFSFELTEAGSTETGVRPSGLVADWEATGEPLMVKP